MLTRDKKGLMVIENFFVDRDLPKFNRNEEKKSKRELSVEAGMMGGGRSFGGGSDGFADNGFFTNGGGIIRHDPKDEALWDGMSVTLKNEYIRQVVSQYYEYFIGKKKFSSKNPILLFAWWCIKKYYNKKFIQTATGSVEEFFVDVKQSPKELKKVDEKLQSYKTYMCQLKSSGQKALLEKVKDNIYVAGREAVMYANGFPKYFTEQQIVEFVSKTERGLRMDWIKNFTRHIPEEVMELKRKCDEQDIFDNYCILHFDPKGEGAELTKKEKEKKKDPVLFGLLKGSSNLYFVGDWIDEYCDLTLDKIVKTIGKNKKITKNYELTEKE